MGPGDRSKQEDANRKNEGKAAPGAVKKYKVSSRRRMNARNKKSDSAFKTISEVADDLEVQQHVLRFWETKFSYVRPLKRGGGRRYYRPEDVNLLKAIRTLLYDKGYKIEGVQKLLREEGKAYIINHFGPDAAKEQNNQAGSDVLSVPVPPQIPTSSLPDQRAQLEQVLQDLRSLRDTIVG